jgi:hypothetical protein
MWMMTDRRPARSSHGPEFALNEMKELAGCRLSAWYRLTLMLEKVHP